MNDFRIVGKCPILSTCAFRLEGIETSIARTCCLEFGVESTCAFPFGGNRNRSFPDSVGYFGCVYMCLPVWRESKLLFAEIDSEVQIFNVSTCAFPFGGNRNKEGAVLDSTACLLVYMCLPVWRESKRNMLKVYILGVPRRSTCAFPFGGNRNAISSISIHLGPP